ncbi:hypothetical protein niasHT_025770 [Heterodera trifolii]|uniref:C2 domain-containing protein n=1 Tax=Heterodera trifolii TaxID=157864 RepID=A0ABD2KR31_9BILA
MNSNGNSQKQRNDGDGLLNKLFTDVIGIVESHLDSRSKTDDDGTKFAIGDGNSGERWQKLYEDMYFELEKVRKLLLNEHQMNVQLQEEKRHLLAEMDFTKIQFERQLAELKGQLEEKGKQIAMLENELEFVAKSGQIRHTVLNTEKRPTAADEHSEKASAIEATELKLQISKVVLTEEAVRQSENPCPMLFLAIEFFDFEIQTTEVTNGPEALFDFTTVFDTPISDLFIHYIRTEGMEIELYSVKDGLSYELWSKAQIPLKKLLSTRTPTHFYGELKFWALSSHGQSEEKQQKEQSLLLATAFYSIEVPFSLLSALNAQRRRMAAMAIIPMGKVGPSDEPFNELIVQIHRCTAIDSLKGDETKKGRQLKPSTYVAYEFFNFPVHLTRTVRESANPAFEDQQSWKVPAESEAVHKYLKEKELLLYLIDEGTDGGTSAGKMSPKARVLASVRLPLFPLARNHKIRGTFPFLDRADESIISEASIDVSIYWKFAYAFDGFENLKVEEKVPLLRTFAQLTEQNGPKEIGQRKKQRIAGENAKKEEGEEKKKPEEMAQKREIRKEQKALERIGIKQRETDKTKGDSSADESNRSESEGTAEEQWGEQMPEEELRRRLLLLPKPKSQMEKAAENESDQSKISEDSLSDETPKSGKSSRSSATIVVDRETALERTTSDELSEDLLKEGSNSAAEGYEPAKEEAAEEEDEEEDGSIRSDATYTAEGPLGPIEMDEPRVIGRTADEEEVMIIRDEDLEGRMGQFHEKIGDGDESDEEKPTETMAPVPAPRRSLLGPIPPITITGGKQLKKLPAPPPPLPTAEELATTRKAVEFAEPLHSSIPPSDVSSSFAEDTTFGSERSSITSEPNGGSTASNGTAPNGNDRQKIEGEGEEKQRKMPRTKRPTKAPIQIAPVPPTPAIRIRPAVLESDWNSERGPEGSSVDLVPPKSANVRIRIGRLRFLDHSPSLHFSHFEEGGRVFVEWNFLDFAREQCVTENDAEMPQLLTESVDLDHQSDYELNQNQIALLTQWTQLNIRLTFTLLIEANNGDLDELGMAELELLNILNTSEHFLILQNMEDLSVAELEVDISYSDNLLEYLGETIRRFLEERKKFKIDMANR